MLILLGKGFVPAEIDLNSRDFRQLSYAIKKVEILQQNKTEYENYLLESSVEAVIEKSKMKSVLNKDTIAEGIVIRPLEEIIDQFVLQGRISFKAINPDFLIKYDE